MLARATGSTSSLIKNPQLAVAPPPPPAVGAATPPPQAAAAKGAGTGLHLRRRPLRPAAGPRVIPGPALGLVVTEYLRAVAVKTTPGTAVGGTAGRPPSATGRAVIPTPARPPRTDTLAGDITGPAPGRRAIRAGAGTGGSPAGPAAGFPNPPGPAEAVQSLCLQDAPSI